MSRACRGCQCSPQQNGLQGKESRRQGRLLVPCRHSGRRTQSRGPAIWLQTFNIPKRGILQIVLRTSTTCSTVRKCQPNKTIQAIVRERTIGMSFELLIVVPRSFVLGRGLCRNCRGHHKEIYRDGGRLDGMIDANGGGLIIVSSWARQRKWNRGL